METAEDAAAESPGAATGATEAAIAGPADRVAAELARRMMARATADRLQVDFNMVLLLQCV
ncbi:hypothetical protein [Kitasatospora sp. NPDC001175]|uniref:Uncharacterized protein n=1 Tax=Kitasatospora cystarginea TaxID=58350 RepID=A0ABP5S071_9ACTN